MRKAHHAVASRVAQTILQSTSSLHPVYIQRNDMLELCSKYAQAWAFCSTYTLQDKSSGLSTYLCKAAAFEEQCAKPTRKASSVKSIVHSVVARQQAPRRVQLYNHFCYLAAQVGRIVTAEHFEQWGLGSQAAKTMLRCLHVTVLKLWGIRNNHLVLSHHAGDGVIGQLEASEELQMAQTATYMKSMTDFLGMPCLATAVATPHGVKLVKCPAAHFDKVEAPCTC